MNRREILNELAQIVAITDGKNISATVAYCPEAAQRAKGLIQVVESWPIAFPPAPFLSDQCANRLHGGCVNGACKCACHCPPEAPQQPKDTRWSLNNPPYPPEAPQQSAEPAPAPERHIDTPDELLELLAGISSDPQIEGLSLAQKTSSMALLHIAKATQQNADMQRIAMDYLMKRNPLIRVHSRRRLHRRSDEAFEAHNLARSIMERMSQPGSDDEKTVDIALMIRGEDPVQSPEIPQEPS